MSSLNVLDCVMGGLMGFIVALILALGSRACSDDKKKD